MADQQSIPRDGANYAQVPDVERPAHTLTPARSASVMMCLFVNFHRL